MLHDNHRFINALKYSQSWEKSNSSVMLRITRNKQRRTVKSLHATGDTAYDLTRHVPHTACDKCTVHVIQTHDILTQEQLKYELFPFLVARDGQPLNSPISILGLKARQSWQRLSLSLEERSSTLRV